MNLKHIKDQVIYCLEKYIQARNSDDYLTQCVWAEFYRDYLEGSGITLNLPLRNLECVASQDDIKRFRAKIQNPKGTYKGMFPPTSWEVARARKWQEEEWRESLGYDPEKRTV